MKLTKKQLCEALALDYAIMMMLMSVISLDASKDH